MKTHTKFALLTTLMAPSFAAPLGLILSDGTNVTVPVGFIPAANPGAKFQSVHQTPTATTTSDMTQTVTMGRLAHAPYGSLGNMTNANSVTSAATANNSGDFASNSFDVNINDSTYTDSSSGNVDSFISSHAQSGGQAHIGRVPTTAALPETGNGLSSATFGTAAL
jgi:hypothetical protein